ncbi:hypothetical protein BC827DRAFT_129713 [Russula dissimulans]|nr:hypothetical protein BC827DRAFT_129713 [Russula dissimulans]
MPLPIEVDLRGTHNFHEVMPHVAQVFGFSDPTVPLYRSPAFAMSDGRLSFLFFIFFYVVPSGHRRPVSRYPHRWEWSGQKHLGLVLDRRMRPANQMMLWTIYPNPDYNDGLLGCARNYVNTEECSLISTVRFVGISIGVRATWYGIPQCRSKLSHDHFNGVWCASWSKGTSLVASVPLSYGQNQVSGMLLFPWHQGLWVFPVSVHFSSGTPKAPIFRRRVDFRG